MINMAREYQVSELSADEDALFDSEWDAFVTKHFRARETVDVFQDHKENIKEACRIAKYQLESSFGGLNANTNEFGWMPIMPNFLLATAAPTYATSTWKQYISTDDVTSRWKNWIGASDNNLKVSKYASLIMIGFADPSELPKIDAIQAKVKGKDYPIWYFAAAVWKSRSIRITPTGCVLRKGRSHARPECIRKDLKLYIINNHSVTQQRR
jgi:hypothetical protein